MLFFGEINKETFYKVDHKEKNLEWKTKKLEVSSIMVTRNHSGKKLKNLNLNPLSVAKYFWSKGVEDYARIQLFLYLTYREVLKKESKVLFKEKFLAWEGGPVLESVHQQMEYHFEEHGTMNCLFEPVEDLEDKTIKPYLTKIYRDYQTAKKKGEEIEFIFRNEDEPWEKVREQTNGEMRPHIFLEPKEIISLTN